MNHFAIKQNAFAACEMRGSSIAMFCPKPRRIGQLAGSDPFRPFRPRPSDESDLVLGKASPELFDIFLTKSGEVAMSPPFFAGSPPTRSANPVVQDPLFVQEKPEPVSPRQKSGCDLTKFGFKPAPTRVEGFDCRIQRGNESGAHRITAIA